METVRHSEALQKRIEDRSAKVGIIGQGYVGLPLAICCAERGFSVTGFDTDLAKAAALNRGECNIKHIDSLRLARVQRDGRYSATSDLSMLADVDVIVICVPTPLSPQREPDMRYVEATAHAVRATLRPGQLIVLESTTYPGTTEELVSGILESGSGLTVGFDYFLAFSPEREDPGNRSFSTATIPKVVGGVDLVSGDIAQQFYDCVVDRTVRVSSARVAEATKLTENIFRAVNIALVNELKVVYDRMGIDIWEVLDAASTKPFGFMRFNPGPGWGGHCIPLDPFYLSWKAREYGQAPKFIELAGEVNVEMARFVVMKLQAALNERSQAVNGTRILILGLAYKKDIDDPRESPAFEIIDHLLKLGAHVSYHDPHISVAPQMRSWPHLPPMTSVPLVAEMIREVDAVMIITDHSTIDYALVAKEARLIVDTRGVYRTPQAHIVRA